jgi:hypothetical protein
MKSPIDCTFLRSEAEVVMCIQSVVEDECTMQSVTCISEFVKGELQAKIPRKTLRKHIAQLD